MDGDTETEIVTFNHVCNGCGAVIAEHYYEFAVTPNKQIYLMDCILCGRGSEEKLLDDEFLEDGEEQGDVEQAAYTIEEVDVNGDDIHIERLKIAGILPRGVDGSGVVTLEEEEVLGRITTGAETITTVDTKLVVESGRVNSTMM